MTVLLGSLTSGLLTLLPSTMMDFGQHYSDLMQIPKVSSYRYNSMKQDFKHLHTPVDHALQGRHYSIACVELR